MLTALDRDKKKADALRLAVPGAARVAAGDATRPQRWWDGEAFDAVVLDVPCSATGILRARPEVKHQQDEASVAALCAQQAAMLRSLWPLLRPGGHLLYMTCSLLRAENEAPVRAFVREQRDAKATMLEAPPSDAATAHRTPLGITFFPSDAHQGGYVALLQKKS